ncbi:MAG TPA: thioesterase [Thermoprotei archaeon]|nr:thioesterase [Thermoprotei archaeon]
MTFKVGEVFSRRYFVEKIHSAKHIGSGDVDVLSTPSMILFMEETCRLHAEKYLSRNETTVGIHVDVYHVKAAPIESEVEVIAKLINIDGKRLTYYVEVIWNQMVIGYGIHDRYIVDRSKFLEKLRKTVGR